MANPQSSEAWSAPLLSPVQRGICDDLRLVCDTAAINGASLGDIRAAAEVFCERVGAAFEDASIAEAGESTRIRFADDDDDGEGPDNAWPSNRFD